MNITLPQLRAFVAVCRYANFTLAARALHRTQPAVTVQIRQLEKELGLTLFDRSTRGLRLTSAALKLAPALSNLLNHLDQTLDESQGIRTLRTGVIRIGCLPSIAAAYLPEKIAAFRAQHEGMSFVLRDELGERLLPMVHSGEVDFAITDFNTPDADLQSTDLLKEQMCAFFLKGSPLEQMPKLGVKELASYDLILMAHGSHARRIVDTAFNAAGYPILPACEASYMSTAIGMVEAGLGVALLPALGVNLRAHPGLASRELSGPLFLRQIAIVQLRHKTLPPGAQTFIQELVDHPSRSA